MSKTVTISDEMAELLETHRQREGQESVDVTAEILIERGIAASEDDFGYTVEELRALIDEGREGPSVEWNAAEVRAEVLRRVAERKAAE